MEIQKYSDIPEDAKKYMFAEDLISYFMILNDLPADFQKVITGQYRHLIPRAFNEVIQISTCFIYCRISVFNTFLSFDANEMVSIGTFLLFAHQLESRYFTDGTINPQKFLYFCTHLAYMTKSFYLYGEKEIPKLAANYIVKTMKSYKTPEVTFWNGLNVAAFKYFKLALECGFIKMSTIESVKIQFVVHESVKEENFNNSSITKVSSIVGKHERDLLKITVKPIKNISVIDNNPCYNGKNQNRTETEKLYEENFNNEILSDSSLTETDEENFDLGEKKKACLENKSEICTPPVDAITDVKMKKKISSKRERLILKIINGSIKRTGRTSSTKKKDRGDCPKIEEKENEFKMTYPASTTEIIASPKKKDQVNCPKTQKDKEYKMTYPANGTETMTSSKKEEQVNCHKMQPKINELNITRTITKTEITVSPAKTYPASTTEIIASPKKKDRVNCPKTQKDKEYKMTHPANKTKSMTSSKKEEQVNCHKMQQKINELNITRTITKTEITVSPEKNEQVNCPTIQQKDKEFKITHSEIRTVKMDSSKKKEHVNCHKMQQKENEFKMTPHHGIRTRIMASPKKEKRVVCSSIKQKEYELKMSEPVIDTSVIVNIENSLKNDEQVNNFIHSNKDTFIKNNVDGKTSDEIRKDSSNKKCCVENKFDERKCSGECKVPLSDNSYGTKSSLEINIARKEVKYVIENERTFLTERNDSECSFSRSIEIAAEDNEVKDAEVEPFDKTKNGILSNVIPKVKTLDICINPIRKDENFAMHDSYRVCNTEAAENSALTMNISKTNLSNVHAVADNEKEENELTHNSFYNKNECTRKVDDQNLLEITHKNTKKNDIDNKEQVLHNLYTSAGFHQTSLTNKSSDELIQHNIVNTEPSTYIDGLENVSNFTLLKNDESEIAETLLSLSQEDSFLFDDFNDSKTNTPASTTVTYSQRKSPRIAEKIYDRLSSSKLNTKSSNSVMEEYLLNKTNTEFLRDENRKQLETENSSMVTVDFDICDKFVIDIVTSADELELYGETHANFLSKEDNFNSTLDILSVVHYMATYYGTEFLEIESLDY